LFRSDEEVAFVLLDLDPAVRRTRVLDGKGVEGEHVLEERPRGLVPGVDVHPELAAATPHDVPGLARIQGTLDPAGGVEVPAPQARHAARHGSGPGRSCHFFPVINDIPRIRSRVTSRCTTRSLVMTSHTPRHPQRRTPRYRMASRSR